MNVRNSFRRAAGCGAALIVLFAGAGTVAAQIVLTIDKALETAMEKSPTIQHRIMDLEQSRENLNAQNAQLKSNFTLSLSPFSRTQDRKFDARFSDWYTTWTESSGSTFRISQPIVKTDGTFSITNTSNWQASYSEAALVKKNRAYTNALSLNLSQPIFTYNTTKMKLRTLELDIENTSIQYALQMLTLERQVKQAFYGVYQDKVALDIAKEEYANQEKSFEIIKNKVDAGLSAKEELYQGELNLASSKASLENSQVGLESSLESFKQTLGLSLDEQIIIQADVTYQPVEISQERAIDHALKTRMELRQRQISIERAMNSIITTSAQNEFKGAINLSYGVTGTNEQIGNMYDKPVGKQTVGLSLDIPLWDWGEKKSRIKAAEINLKGSQLSLEEDKTSMILAIRQACRNLNNLVSQIAIAGQNITNAERTYEINLERYKNGDLTSMDLNLYQTQLSQKKTSLTNAQINYKLGLLSLKILTLWDFEKNAPVVPDLGQDILQSAKKE